MNCTRCDKPLEMGAHFCRNCGLPVRVAVPNDPANGPEWMEDGVREDSPTNPIEPWQAPQPAPVQPVQPLQPLPLRPSSQSIPRQQTGVPAQPQPQQPYYQPTQPVMPGSLPESVQGGRPMKVSATRSARRRRRRGGCFGGCFVTLLMLAILLLGGWFFVARPYLHAFARSQIDLLLANAVNQIPANVTQVPPGTVQVGENAVDNLIVLNSAPSDPVQHVQMHITPGGVRLDFQVYGFACAVTGVPQVINAPLNGQLVVTNVTVCGIVALIISPEELTSLINTHLAAAQMRFKHPIISVLLKNHELDLLVGPPIASVGARAI